MDTKKESPAEEQGQSLSHFKGNYSLSQLQAVRHCLYSTPKTMLQVSRETGIERAYVCRAIGKLRNRGQVVVVNYVICPISKHRAGLYTPNPALFGEEVING